MKASNKNQNNWKTLNVCIIGEDLLRALCKLLYLKNTMWQRFDFLCERHFYMKITLTMIPTNLVALFFHFHRNQKQKLNFQKTDGLFKKNISVFCL